MSAQCGGTTSCTYDLVKGLHNQNMIVDILSFSPAAGDKLISNENFIKIVPRSDSFISKSYKKALGNSIYQLFHANGIWEYTELISAKIVRKKKIPYSKNKSS
jgi:hypothetical protein